MTNNKFYTDYRTAVHWLGNSFVLCNNIVEADVSIHENAMFPYYDEETDEYIDIYQWYLTDASKADVEYLQETFGLFFTYSNDLDLFVLCVPHFGTAWDAVPCEVNNADWIKYNGEKYKFKY